MTTAVVVLVIVAAGTALVSYALAEQDALEEAEAIAEGVARRTVQPVLDEALTGMPDGWEDLDRRVQNRLSDGSILALVVWSERGEVLYSDDPSLVGRVFPPSPELLAAVDGQVTSGLETDPEVGRTLADELVEVYVPLRAGGEDLALETYFDAAGIVEDAAALRRRVIPLAVGALLVLQGVQVPIAVSLFRRVRRQDSERAQLMARSLAASDRERRAIAADVHDGPVQDLAGISYALSALRQDLPPERRATLDRLTEAVRQAIQSLRQLIVDLYPPELSGAGLGMALNDLTTPLRGQGIDVRVDAQPIAELDPATTAAVYRTAKEALTNVSRHAAARHAWVTLGRLEDEGSPMLRLQVADDGVGMTASSRDVDAGHVGIRLMSDRVADLGGRFAVAPREGGGTIVTVELPVPDAALAENRSS